MHHRQYRPGEVIVPKAQRARFPHPLRGTDAARRLRRGRRYIQATLLARRHNGRLPADAPTLQFYPIRPSPKSSMVRLCARLGLRVGFDPDGPGTVFAWDDRHYFPAAALRRLPPGAINGRCVDVSKSHVDALWEEVAGYGLQLDPTKAAEPIVVKSEENGNHDGRLLMGPLDSVEPGLVYERLVESLDHDGRIYTVRPLVLGGRLPMAYEVWRPYPRWFHGGAEVLPARTEDVLSEEERALVLRFAERIGLQYGEVDVLRDRSSGRIYVVDANRTPLRPLSMAAHLDAAVYQEMARHFAEFLAERGAAPADYLDHRLASAE